MHRVLRPDEIISTRRFGGFCPYYHVDTHSGLVTIADCANEIFDSLPQENRRIDPVACLGLLCFNYPLGDRTLIEGVYRMPWHAILDGKGHLHRSRPIPHGHCLAEPVEIAKKLRECLQTEISQYVEGHSRVFILLSGGLDSRVTAGIISEIQKDTSLTVHGLTWGDPKSRDVVYARAIARHFNWDWHHLRYDADTSWQNLAEAAEWGGAEVAGVHLHAMKQLEALVQPSDVVIASSWGDSIGRGEFSGQHISRLAMRPTSNKHWLVHRSLAAACIQDAESDRKLAWSTEPDGSQHVIIELDKQENYMRRMIGHAMNYIMNFCRLEQAFTAERTVETMWSYSPVCRQSEVYFRLFEMLDPFLYDLPWARTGIAPSGKTETDKSLTTRYQHWGAWLRDGKANELRELIVDGGLGELGIFNMAQVRSIYRTWRSLPSEATDYTQTILKLAGIELLRRRYEITGAGDRTGFIDRMLSLGISRGKKLSRAFA